MDVFRSCTFVVEGKTRIETRNFLRLMTGSTAERLVRPENDLSVREFNRRLRARTVCDVCPAMQG